MTVAVVGDGAVDLMGGLAAAQMGADRIIAMSRHKTRQDLAMEHGAIEIVQTRAEAGVAEVKALTGGICEGAVLTCVGTSQSIQQAIQITRPGAMIGHVGVPYEVQLAGQKLFFSQTGMQGGPAPVRRFWPHLMDIVLARKINPSRVSDLFLPLAEIAEGDRAMDERRAIKTLLRIWGGSPFGLRRAEARFYRSNPAWQLQCEPTDAVCLPARIMPVTFARCRRQDRAEGRTAGWGNRRGQSPDAS